MSNFIVKKIDEGVILLLCLDYNSILSYINEISSNNYIMNSQGTLIVDQLLVVGNGQNRFLKCNYSYGNIDYYSSETIEFQKNNKYREISSDLLRNNSEYLEYSILTDSQLETINDGGSV